MDSDRAPADFEAVGDDVIGFGFDRLGPGLEQHPILILG